MRIQYGIENFVFDFYQLKRLKSGLFFFGGHQRHLIAHIADYVIKQHHVVRRRFGISLAGGGIDAAGDILPGKNAGNPGEGARPGYIYSFDSGHCVRTAQHFHREHAGLIIVVGKKSAARDQAPGIELDGAFFHFRKRIAIHGGILKFWLVPVAANAGRPVGRLQ